MTTATPEVSSVQASANRTNSHLSTGPRTAAGKDASSKNALVHGLRSTTPVIKGEKLDDWLAFRDSILQDLAPIGTVEYELASRIALLLWRQRRTVRFETGIVNYQLDQAVLELRKITAMGDSSQLASQQADKSETISSDAKPSSGDVATPSPVSRPHRDAATVARELERQEKDVEDIEWMLEQISILPKLKNDQPFVRANEFIDRLVWDPARLDLGMNKLNETDLLKSARVPEDWHNRPGDWPEWSVANVKGAVKYIAIMLSEGNFEEDDGLPDSMKPSKTSQLISSFLFRRRTAYESTLNLRRSHLCLLQQELAKIHDIHEAAECYLTSARCLLPDTDLEKAIRYEVHLTRELCRAIDAFEQIQALRTPGSKARLTAVLIKPGKKPKRMQRNAT